MRDTGFAPSSAKASEPAHDPSVVRAATEGGGEPRSLLLPEAGGNQFFLTLLGRSAIQPKSRIGRAGDRFEQEADRAAAAVVRETHGDAGGFATTLSVLPGGAAVQRKCAKCGGGTTSHKCAACEKEEHEELEGSVRALRLVGDVGEDAQVPVETDAIDAAPAETTPAESPAPDESMATEPAGAEAAASEAAVGDTAVPESAAATTYLVDDDAEQLGADQMRKTEFLDALRPAVCGAVDQALAGTGRDSSGCPHVEYWFARLADKSASFIERSLRRFAPEAQGASSAIAYIPAIVNRVTQSAQIWVSTGEVQGVPDELAGVVGAEAPPDTGTGAAVQMKARSGGGRAPDDPAGVRDELGAGRPLDTAVRNHMESAYGAHFGNVRVHTDAVGARLSERLNAHAFTVGEHVAFGTGEYQPGSLVGDALIAHELAHVIQQRGGISESASPAETNAFEADADRSAGGVMMRALRGTTSAVSEIISSAGPRLRSGLRLQRCKKDAPFTCPTQTVTMAGAECGARYGAIGTYCYSGATNWWFKENVTNGSPNTCDTSPISQTGTPFQSTSNCVQDAIFDMNGPPAGRAPCKDVTNQTVFTGPTRADVEKCQYQNEQIIEVTKTSPTAGKVITSSAGVSTDCSWP